MLYWGRPDLIISPFTNTAKPLSSFTAVIPNNDGDYVPSLFERIMEPLREYTLVKLKRKQLIAQLTRTGYNIDIENARNLDLGNGDVIGWEEVVKIKLQTGIQVFSSKGVNPLNEERPPISQGVPDDDIQKIMGLTETLNGIGNEIRELIGVPSYRDGTDVGDRTSGKLAESQNQGSFNVTDFIATANMQLWEETFYKLCLLHWNDVVKDEPETKEDLLNFRFDLEIKMKITEYQKELLEADIQRFSQMPDSNGQPLITPKDAFILRNIDNYKLACWYLQSVVDQNRKKAIQDSERLQAQNAQVQQASNQQAAAQQQQMQADKIAAEKDMLVFKTQEEMKLATVNGLWQAIAKGIMTPDVVMPVIQQLIPNISIPLMQENKEIQQGLMQQDQQEQMEQEQAAQQNPQEEAQEQQQQPQQAQQGQPQQQVSQPQNMQQ
jgi:hypothetical protein